MSGINIKVEPGQQIEINGRSYEAVAFRCPIEDDYWLGQCVRTGSYPEPRLILRPLPQRKVPTDQDAAVWPRRKCWVRDDENKPWEEEKLIAVTNNIFPFSTINDLCEKASWRFCEIEVEE